MNTAQVANVITAANPLDAAPGSGAAPAGSGSSLAELLAPLLDRVLAILRATAPGPLCTDTKV